MGSIIPHFLFGNTYSIIIQRGNKMKKSIFVITLLISLMPLLGLLTGCGQVPLTGRKQMIIVSDADMLALGDQQYKEILSKSQINQDQNKYQMVVRVGNRITGAVDSFLKQNGLSDYTAGYKWEFNLIQDDNTVNAFCLPGGKIAVYSGIIPVAKNDTGLAVVMSHEIAHALAKHGAERLSQVLLVQYGGASLSDALKQQPAETQKYMMLAFGIGANVGVLLPYNRLQEKEADRIGLAIMARAGYDPHEALSFWERMEKLESGAPPEFLSTHPATTERIKEIQAEIPEAMKYYKQVK